MNNLGWHKPFLIIVQKVNTLISFANHIVSPNSQRNTKAPKEKRVVLGVVPPTLWINAYIPKRVCQVILCVMKYFHQGFRSLNDINSGLTLVHTSMIVGPVG